MPARQERLGAAFSDLVWRRLPVFRVQSARRPWCRVQFLTAGTPARLDSLQDAHTASDTAFWIDFLAIHCDGQLGSSYLHIRCHLRRLATRRRVSWMLPRARTQR